MDSDVSTSRDSLKSFPYWTYSKTMQNGGNKMATRWRYRQTVSSPQLYSLSQSLPDGEGNPEQHLGAFEENRVPDLEHGGRRQAGGEDGEEPLHGEHVGERRLVATWSETEASTHSRGPAEEAPMCFTPGFLVGGLLEEVEMLGESGQLQTQQVSEHGHVH